MVRDELPVAVIGAGPVGLAAACHLLERGLVPVLLEAGEAAAAAVAQWDQVRMFSPWAYNLDKAAVRLLRRHGWQSPDPDLHPTGAELRRLYLEPLARTPEIAARLRLGTRVTGIARHRLGKVRDGEDRAAAPFALRLQSAAGEERLLARAVIDASGTWELPSPAGADGLPAIGERDPAVAARIRYGMPDVLGGERARYAGRRVAVLGSGHSAIGSLIELAELAEAAPGTRITWLLRRADLERVYGGGARDALAERGALGARLRGFVEAGRIAVVSGFLADRLTLGAEDLRVEGETPAGPAAVTLDELIVATGFRPDLGFLGELRLDLDSGLECPRVLAPLIDPNLHSCGTVRPHGAAELAQPEPGFYIAGMKSYGRAPTFLLATGHEQVRSIAAALAGDEAAARRVELELPETGVCSSDLRVAAETAETTESGCCGGPAPTEAEAEACCARDAAAKAEGLEGCGCPEAEPAVAGGGCGAR